MKYLWNPDQMDLKQLPDGMWYCETVVGPTRHHVSAAEALAEAVLSNMPKKWVCPVKTTDEIPF